jgi:hypothetical protein
MIGYAPIDFEPVRPVARPRSAPVPAPVAVAGPRPFQTDLQECDYVLMMFIAGVILLALSDMSKK